MIVCGAVIAGVTLSLAHTASDEPSPVHDVVHEIVYIEVPVKVESSTQEPFYRGIADNLTQDDIDLLAKIIYLEAGDQSITGQRAVAEVVFNRMLDDRFPDTLSDVILAPGQFSTVRKLNSAMPSDEQYQAIEETLSEVYPILPHNVIFFATYEANGTLYERIGDHYFCYG